MRDSLHYPERTPHVKRFALIVFALLIFVGYAHADTVNLRLGPEGEILGWLALGPFANPGSDEKHCRGFDTDLLAGSGTEAYAAAIEGQSVVSTSSVLKWQLMLADTASGLGFVPAFDRQKPGVVYAYAEVRSPSARDARLLIGSDDGVKVWVNGKLILTSHQTRGVKRDEDKADIRLNQGPNRLLFKVDQHFGGWGLLARITDPDGKPMPDLAEILDVQKTKDTSVTRFVRSAAGKPGALDADALNRYASWQHKTWNWMPWFRTNDLRAEPYDEVLGQVQRKVDAAQSKGPEALSKVLADMADFLKVQYDVEWDALAKRMQNPKPLMQTNIAKEDYVRTAPDGRYFVHPDGTFFIPLGYNHNPDWSKTVESAPSITGYSPQVTDQFFKHLHECGVNVLRMMFEAPAGGHLMEDPIGTFRPEQIAFLDNIVTLARKHEIKLMITPWDTFWMNHRWDANPYNAKNGGQVAEKVDFLTKREVIEAQKKRWKFIIDRWGNTGTVFAWELFNEIDLWWDASPEQIQAWVKEMGDYVRTYEKQKWGRNHVITVSIARPFPKDGYDVIAYTQPENEVANTHLYVGAANAPSEPIGPAQAIREGVTFALDRIKDNRPYIDTEDGPINHWIADEKLDDQVFHNMVWAHMASGGAGSGMRWPYRNPHHLSEGMYQELKLMSRFVKDVPWQKLTGAKSEIKVTVPEGWIECSTATKCGALVWVTSAKPSAGEISISWPYGPKSIRYLCYDTKTGEWFAKGSASGNKIPLDGKHSSVAIIIE